MNQVAQLDASITRSQALKTAAQPPLPVVSAKLMQQYRLEAPVSAAGEVQAVLDGTGNLAVFTTGTNNRIYANRFTSGSDTGWSQTDTGLQSSQFGVGLDANGRLVVAIPSVTDIVFVEENADGSWGSPQTISVAALGTIMSGVRLKRLRNTLFVLATGGPSGGQSYAFFGAWNGAQTAMTVAPSLAYAHGDVGWNTPFGGAGLFIATLDNRLFFFPNGGADQGFLIPLPANLRLFNVAVGEDANGESLVCALMGADDLYIQPYVLDAAAATWTCVDPSRVEALAGAAGVIVNAAGLLEIFTAGTDEQGANLRLFHVRQSPGAPAGPTNAAGWDVTTVLMPGALVQKNVTGTISVCLDGDGDPNLFAVTTDSLLFQVSQEESQDANTGLWNAVEIEQASTTNLDELTTYCTEITVLDAAGVAKPNAKVQLWAEDPILAIVAGQAYLLDPTRALSCTANVAGMVTVVVPTDSLHTPRLKVWTDMMDPNDRFIIEPNQAIQDRLRGVTTQQLIDAKDMEANPIIPQQFRDRASLDQLQQALTSAMSFVQPGPLVRYVAHDSGGFPARIDATRVPEQHWQFDCTSGNLTFRRLSAQQAQAEIARLQAKYSSASSPLDWLNDLGDLMDEAITGAVQKLTYTVTTAADGVHALITIVIDAVTYSFNATITFIEEVFGLVETLFKTVLVKFDDLFRWLGELFNWTKIRLTHQAVKYIIQDVGLPFLQGALTGLETVVADGFTWLRPRIQDGLEAATSVLGGPTASFLSEQPYAVIAPRLQAALSNNIVVDAFLDNLPGVTSATAPGRARAADDPVTSLADLFTTLATQFKDSTSGQNLVNNFTSLANADSVIQAQLGSLLPELLQNPAGVALDQIQAVVVELIGLIQDAIGTINDDLLNMRWDAIPLLDDLYAKYVDPNDRLTALSVMALAIALPADAGYFAAFDRHPFESDEDLKNFQTVVTAEWLLQKSGLAANRSATRVEIPADARQIVSQVFGYVLAASYAVLSYTHRIVDTASSLDTPPPATIKATAVLAGWIRWIAAAPWALDPDNDAPAAFSTDPREFGNMAWMHNMLTPVMGTVFAIPSDKPASNDVTAVTFTITGLIQEVFACVFAGMDAPNHPSGHAERIFSFFPITFKFLRLSRLVTASRGFSLAALLVANDLCWYTSAGLRIAQLMPPSGSPQDAPSRLNAVPALS